MKTRNSESRISSGKHRKAMLSEASLKLSGVDNPYSDPIIK